MTTPKGGQPIGQCIRQVCAALEKHGPQTAKALHALEPDIPAAYITKYARRAIGHGLTTIDRSTWPHTYAVAQGWRFWIDRNKRLKAERAPLRAATLPPNSIFQMGERAGAQA